MLCTQADAKKPATPAASSNTADTGKIRLGGACRLPAKTADAGKIRLGGACRDVVFDHQAQD